MQLPRTLPPPTAAQASGSLLLSTLMRMRQVQGWNQSWQSLQAFIRQNGSFQGILGFSQGTGIAAVLCALQQQQSRRQQQQQQQEQQKQHQEDCNAGPAAVGAMHSTVCKQTCSFPHCTCLVAGCWQRCSSHWQRCSSQHPGQRSRRIMRHGHGHMLTCKRSELRVFLLYHQQSHQP